MTTYTLEEAATRLPELVARATSGEDVVITRPNETSIHLVPGDEEQARTSRPMTQADIEWLRAHRVKLAQPVDMTALVREMRDEDP